MALTSIEEDFVSLMAPLGELHGLDKLSTVIFAILYLSPEAVTMETIAEKTGYSAASISNSIKLINRLGFLEIRRKPKSKTLYISMRKDICSHMRSVFEMAYNTKIRPAIEGIPVILEKHKATKQKIEKEKLKLIENYYQHMLHSEKIIKLILNELERLDKS